MSEPNRITPDDRCYMRSLLLIAEHQGLIGDDFIQDLRSRFHGLLRQQLGTRSGRRAASAEDLRDSILFALSEHLMTLGPAEALSQLRERPLEDCLRDGIARVRSMTKAAELLHQTELRRPLPADNELLRSALRERLPEFFRRYDPACGAHELHVILDYPVLFYPQGYQGIGFVRRYLDSLVLENRFLRLFPEPVLTSCLSLYAARNGFNLYNLYGNLYEIVLACTVAGFDTPDAMLDSLRADSPALREYVRRTCEVYATDLRRILQQMS